MNPCGTYRIYAGEVSHDRKTVAATLEDVNDPTVTMKIIFPLEDWGSVRIGAKLEIVSCGRTRTTEGLEGGFMLLSELAGRNVSAALRETLNAAVVMEMRQSNMMRLKDEPWFKDEHRKHDLIRDQLASLSMQLESIQGRLKELREF